MVIVKSKQKKFEGDLKIILCGIRPYPTESIKYLGVKIDTNLSWKYHVNDLFVKLNRSNTLLFKMTKYLNLKILIPSILLFLTPTYPIAVFSGLRIVPLFNEL